MKFYSALNASRENVICQKKKNERTFHTTIPNVFIHRKVGENLLDRLPFVTVITTF